MISPFYLQKTKISGFSFEKKPAQGSYKNYFVKQIYIYIYIYILLRLNVTIIYGFKIYNCHSLTQVAVNSQNRPDCCLFDQYCLQRSNKKQ